MSDLSDDVFEHLPPSLLHNLLERRIEDLEAELRVTNRTVKLVLSVLTLLTGLVVYLLLELK